MPSSKCVDVKEGGGSEHLKGEKEEEWVRQGKREVCRMPSPLTGEKLPRAITIGGSA